MSRLFKFSKALAMLVIAGAISLSLPSMAHASTIIALSEDGGAFTTVATGASLTNLTFTGTFGDFTVSIAGVVTTNGASLSDILGSTTSISNNSTASHTLMVMISSQDYTLPAGTFLHVESGQGGSISSGTVGMTGVFQAYANASNLLGSTAGFTNGPQTGNQTGSTYDTGSANGVFTRNPVAPYSLTTIANLTISGGGVNNYSNHENLTPVPEPATLSLLGLGLVGIAFGKYRKSVAK